MRLIAILVLLSACGAGAPPLVPQIGGSSTIEMNSQNGMSVSNRLEIGVRL